MLDDCGRSSKTEYLENLFAVATGDAAGGADLDLTLRFPDHIALWKNQKS